MSVKKRDRIKDILKKNRKALHYIYFNFIFADATQGTYIRFRISIHTINS